MHPRLKIVQDAHLVAFFEQQVHGVGPDKTGAAGH
jgi:hypothetical protein